MKFEGAIDEATFKTAFADHPILCQPQSRLGARFERHARTVAAFVTRAMIRIMLRRLTRTIYYFWIATFRIGLSTQSKISSPRVIGQRCTG